MGGTHPGHRLGINWTVESTKWNWNCVELELWGGGGGGEREVLTLDTGLGAIESTYWNWNWGVRGGTHSGYRLDMGAIESK